MGKQKLEYASFFLSHFSGNWLQPQRLASMGQASVSKRGVWSTGGRRVKRGRWEGLKNPDRQPRSGTEHRPRFAHRCSSRPSSPNARLSQYTHTQVASVRRIYYLQLGGSMIHLGYMAAYNAPARLMRGVEAKGIRNCSSPPSSNHRDRPGCQSLELVR